MNFEYARVRFQVQSDKPVAVNSQELSALNIFPFRLCRVLGPVIQTQIGRTEVTRTEI